jgi:hypothetical protein
MIAINAELGFQVLGHWLGWELAVADVLAADGRAAVAGPVAVPPEPPGTQS